MLLAERLGKRYDSRWVIRDLGLELSAGHVLAITGDNGSGKTTLLKLLAGLISPSTGSVRRTGRAGLAAIDGALYPHLSAREHIELVLEATGRGGSVIEPLEQVGLRADERASAMSAGMRMRLKLAISLQLAEGAWLLDEPSACMDEAGRRIVAELVKINSARFPIAIATNNPADLAMASHELRLES